MRMSGPESLARTAASAVVDLVSIRVPVLVLTGELDLPTRQAAGDVLASLIPSAQRAIIPRAGHLPNLDNPSAYNETLLRFLSEKRPQAGFSNRS